MRHHELRAAALPHRAQRCALRLLHLFGWSLRYKLLPGRHGVIIIYPHTSHWDVVVGLLAKWALGLPFRWVVKESLLRGVAGKTIGPLLRALGAIPSAGDVASGSTAQLAERMRGSDWFWLALAPEGARAYRPHWRSGFYHLAMAARVPVVLVYLDYASKEIGIVDSVRLSGDQNADMAGIAAVYRGRTGRHPDRASPVTLAPPASGDSGDSGKQAR